jgi:hypothetical protein
MAVATLAQLSLQSARIDDAIMYFGKTAALARTQGEIVNALTCEFPPLPLHLPLHLPETPTLFAKIKGGERNGVRT